LFHEFSGLDLLGTLALVDIANLSCFNHDYLRTFTQALDFSMENIHRESNSWTLSKNYLTRTYTFDWSQLPLINMVETRPQLIVVSSLLGGNPFDGGI
jgi:hypothetical protein